MHMRLSGRGIGLAVGRRGVAVPLAAPANTVAPVLSGTAQAGELLSVTDGTWTGNPAPTYTYQWQRDTGGGYANIGGETANTFLLTATDVGATIRCVVTGTNSQGSASANSNATATVVAASGLTAPDVTVTSAAGAVPEVDIGLKSDHAAGFYLDIQRANNSSSDFSSIAMSIFYQLQPANFPPSSQPITAANLTSEGYTNPTGAYSQRYRIRREDGVVSAWVVITGTVTASTGVLSTTDGTAKAASFDTATYSGLGGAKTVSDAAGRGARTEVEVTGKRHFEVTVDSVSAVAGNDLLMGVVELTADVSGAAFPGAGSTNPNGASIRVGNNTNNITQGRNNSSATTTNMGSVIAVGDVYICEFDTAADTVTFWRHRSGTDTLIYTATLTSKVPTQYAAYLAGYNIGDQFTINFGGSAWVKTPTTDYAGW